MNMNPPNPYDGYRIFGGVERQQYGPSPAPQPRNYTEDELKKAQRRHATLEGLMMAFAQLSGEPYIPTPFPTVPHSQPGALGGGTVTPPPLSPYQTTPWHDPVGGQHSGLWQTAMGHQNDPNQRGYGAGSGSSLGSGFGPAHPGSNRINMNAFTPSSVDPADAMTLRGGMGDLDRMDLRGASGLSQGGLGLAGHTSSGIGPGLGSGIGSGLGSGLGNGLGTHVGSGFGTRLSDSLLQPSAQQEAQEAARQQALRQQATASTPPPTIASPSVDQSLNRFAPEPWSQYVGPDHLNFSGNAPPSVLTQLQGVLKDLKDNPTTLWSDTSTNNMSRESTGMYPEQSQSPQTASPGFALKQDLPQLQSPKTNSSSVSLSPYGNSSESGGLRSETNPIGKEQSPYAYRGHISYNDYLAPWANVPPSRPPEQKPSIKAQYVEVPMNALSDEADEMPDTLAAPEGFTATKIVVEFPDIHSPHDPKVNLWDKLAEGKPLTDEEVGYMSDVIGFAQGLTLTPQDVIETQYLEQIAKEKIIENWYVHAPRDEDGFVLIDDVPYDPDLALIAKSLDTDHYWGVRKHPSREFLAQMMVDYLVGVYDYFIGESLDTLSNPDAGIPDKAVAFVDLLGGFETKEWGVSPGKAIKPFLNHADEVYGAIKPFNKGALKVKAKYGIKVIKSSQAKRLINANQTTSVAPWSRGRFPNPTGNFQKHFDDHKHEFLIDGIKDPNDYLNSAWDFLSNPPQGTLIVRLTDDMYDKQRLLLYHPDSNRMMFTSVNKLGHRVPNTYFKPDKPWGEFFKSSGSQSKRSRLYRIE